MNRRHFLKTGLSAPWWATAMPTMGASNATSVPVTSGEDGIRGPLRPLAIAMWDFSWLERRWPGAGYEDWDQALSELVDRGYDAVRIDAYPHLLANDPQADYLLLPIWSTQDWGSPEIIRVKVQPHLNIFLDKCRQYGVRVGLSSWFRPDESGLQLTVKTPEQLADIWIAALDGIDAAGLLDSILYIDLCNEWPHPIFSPFFDNEPPDIRPGAWETAKSRDWMRRASNRLRHRYPQLPCTFSMHGEVTDAVLSIDPPDMLDLLEPHIWMVTGNNWEFYRTVDYFFAQFSYEDYRNLALRGESTYRAKPVYWQKALLDQIHVAAQWSRQAGLPLMTTESWGLIDYKDWPMLDWGYVKELCALGTTSAAATGRWLAISTSNFCGPQFRGMWRDVSWHRRLTASIHEAPVDAALSHSLLARRIRETATHRSGTV